MIKTSQMFRRVIILPFCLLLLANASAQQGKADSMANLLKGNLTDSARANAMIMQGMYYESVDTAKAHQLYQQARKFAEEKKLNYFISRAWQFEGFLYNLQGDNERAIEYLKNALPYAQKSERRDYQLLYIKELTNLATNYLDAGDAKNALSYQLTGLKVSEKLETVRVADYINVSNIYLRMDEAEEAEKYVFEALKLARKHNSKPEIFQAYIFISLYYGGINKYAEAKKYVDTARFFNYCSFDELAAATNEDMAYNSYQGFYLTTAEAFTNLNITDSAAIFYQKAYELAKEKNIQRDMIEPQLRLGELYLKEKKYGEAEPLLLKALTAAAITQNIKAVSSASKFLSQLYAEKGAYEKAYTYFKQYHVMLDSVTGLEKKKFTKELEVKYETEKKEQQLKLQEATIKQDRLWKYILAGTLVSLLLIAIVSLRSYRNKQKLLINEQQLQQQQIKQLENEKQLLATQSVVKGQEEERSRLAKDLHDGLGGILSGAKYSLSNMRENLIITPENAEAFEKTMNMLDLSINELRRVAHNMMPESLSKLSFDESLKDLCRQVKESTPVEVTYQSFNIEGVELENTVKITIYRIVQELLNNIVKHAAATQAMVQLIRNESQINITVEDNGKGFDKQLLQQSTGMGLANLRNRVDFLKGHVDVQSAPGNGSSIQIEIPLA